MAVGDDTGYAAILVLLCLVAVVGAAVVYMLRKGELEAVTGTTVPRQVVI